ncbi:MAG: UDP-N-acetylglucosamine 4,6-dehydratase [Candidatus Ozemobacter sibiricus]|jgi:UDP-N-acetylglucosamine 4,6-dehydratase|uniref:UDP-N-acetylglucosamine 4,6-dehydratase n=1 Tax=Candidatus Ozemobacter sibiricus TaxID=2268124 RepID=A0A367ZR04_9BACT|nr:MAG: UDP-N-acetylglucosamine 4,6-dehydratase [Candidatus Ozemobacter sibiricus]
MFTGKTILITGGTGSFGQAFVRHALDRLQPRKVIVYSRDEFKQACMAREIASDRLRFFIGDVRDIDRLRRALVGVDYVVHAAALKQVPAAEYNPFEAVQTNILGAQNVITAALDCGVRKVVALSTDKACNPINLYGATKLCSDKLFIAANAYAGQSPTRFAVVRYGNVLGSRGSVVPLFKEAAARGEIPLTDERMTRFWVTLPQAVATVVAAFRAMHGGEMFIPKLPSLRIVDLAKALAPQVPIRVIGIRPGEKLHEVMISADESRTLFETPSGFVKMPEFPFWPVKVPRRGRPVPPGFQYASDTNSEWLGVAELRALLQREGWL